MQSLLYPSEKIIENYLDKFKKDERYSLADSAIKKLIEAFPKNNKIEEIILKICVINSLYSTNIYGTFKLAKHILNLQIDKAIKNGDPEIVNQIAIGHTISNPSGTGDRNFYSFATKYCSWHNIQAYPIYDSFVEKILILYQKDHNFSSFTIKDLKDYKKFKRIINDFKGHYNLTSYGLKEIDKFLWMYSKEYKKIQNNETLY